LARREHARVELEGKLRRAGIGADECTVVLDRLEAEGLLSDARFAENFVRSRRERGYGPLKIAAELRQRGVSEIIVNSDLANLDGKWLEVARTLYRKRWGAGEIPDYREKARRARFLSGRGFPEDIVRRVLRDPG
jgi:regulatory protein